MSENKYYKPLPDCLTIKESPIHGLGLFAKEDIPAGINLGITHYDHDGYITRTPLGGFYNHSNEPNCERIENENYMQLFDQENSQTYYCELFTLRKIKAGEEITVKYTLYNPEN